MTAQSRCLKVNGLQKKSKLLLTPHSIGSWCAWLISVFIMEYNVCIAQVARLRSVRLEEAIAQSKELEQIGDWSKGLLDSTAYQ
jgi:hypothetical protein